MIQLRELVARARILFDGGCQGGLRESGVLIGLDIHIKRCHIRFAYWWRSFMENSSSRRKKTEQMTSARCTEETVFIHETACVDAPVKIGKHTKIWHFSHVMSGAEFGEKCNLGQNVFVAGSVKVGNNVKIQNNVSLYDGCVLEDDVFCGPSVVFTNIKNPRSAIVRKGSYLQTIVERGATLGANCTIVCGRRIGAYAFIAAGAVVTADVVPYALMVGVPARQKGWVGHAGLPLRKVEGTEPPQFVCPETSEKFVQIDSRTLAPCGESKTESKDESVVTMGVRTSTMGEVSVPMLDLKAQFQQVEAAVRGAMDRVLATQHFILGEEVEALEKELAEYTGARYAIACASGSDALLLALKALDVKPGDEVITVPYTFFATAGAIWRLGCRPVFADIDLATFNLDPEYLNRLCTSKTRVILPVHLFGQCAEMDSILEFARQKGLRVIEDAAQALGCRYRGRMAGTLGDIGCYSFFPSKNLGGYGDGGMVVTNDSFLANRLRLLRTHGAKQKYFHEMVGINSRLDAVQAAILRAKLPYLESWSASRRAHANTYREMFHRFHLGLGVEGLEDRQSVALSHAIVLPQEMDHAHHVYNQFVIRASAQHRDALREYLRRFGVATDVYYPLPMHLQPCAKVCDFRADDCSRSEQASRESLALPVFPELTGAQQEKVVAAISRYFDQFKEKMPLRCAA